MPYHLGQMFGLLDECGTKQVVASEASCVVGGSGALARHCISLLEAIEGLGQAGSMDQDVDVVVQRVYSIPLADSSPVSILKHRTRSSTAPPPAERSTSRLCVLVQDDYGTFSVVQLQPLPRSNELHRFCQMWQGRTCVLRGIKVVQRVTRERHSRLFSLIDSLWPSEMLDFCRKADLLVQLQVSATCCQSETKTCRCSFVATVLYRRMQRSDVGQGEVWLVLTDPSLQEEQLERPCRRTVALCVNTSCVLISSVLEALNSPAVYQMSFRDAIRENGVLLCGKQSVIEVCSVERGTETESTTGRDSPCRSLPEPQVKTLLQPYRLDSLGLETTPNSLCTLTGVVVGVDENTAYSWPVCNCCGSDNLKLSSESSQTFHCMSCKSALVKPDTKVQLEVFLTSSSLNDCTMKVKLQQMTILSLLNAGAAEGSELHGYDVESILGKEVGPITVYVRVVTRKPALWIGLEEISLRGCR
uniref:KIAA0146 n=1 Tax=Nothobranchius korthausae TaxID=1143690 RepID=A0A1A8GUH8_9TELE